MMLNHWVFMTLLWVDTRFAMTPRVFSSSHQNSTLVPGWQHAHFTRVLTNKNLIGCRFGCELVPMDMSVSLILNPTSFWSCVWKSHTRARELAYLHWIYIYIYICVCVDEYMYNYVLTSIPMGLWHLRVAGVGTILYHRG
jgi:hypothetical protein